MPLFDDNIQVSWTPLGSLYDYPEYVSSSFTLPSSDREIVVGDRVVGVEDSPENYISEGILGTVTETDGQFLTVAFDIPYISHDGRVKPHTHTFKSRWRLARPDEDPLAAITFDTQLKNIVYCHGQEQLSIEDVWKEVVG